MLTKQEANDYIAAHPRGEMTRSQWILEAIKYHDGLRFTEIQRLWVQELGLDYDEKECLNRQWDNVLGKWINMGAASARIHRGRGCDHFFPIYNAQGLFGRYCEHRGNKYYVVKPIQGPWLPKKRYDGNKSSYPAIGEYADGRICS